MSEATLEPSPQKRYFSFQSFFCLSISPISSTPRRVAATNPGYYMQPLIGLAPPPESFAWFYSVDQVAALPPLHHVALIIFFDIFLSLFPLRYKPPARSQPARAGVESISERSIRDSFLV